MTQKSELGKLGEDLACKYLRKKGYKIIERNYWKPWGELDIVAVSPEKLLVIFEVKTVAGNPPFISGEDQMSKAKLKKLRRTAELYANGPGAKRVGRRGWRIDLVAVTMEENRAAVKHYENI